MLVEIWSDVVCPWCAVGKARLDATLDDLGWRDEIEVHWRSFELDPARPTSLPGTDPGTDYLGMLATKYGTSRDQAQAMVDQMTAAGAAEGIEFRFDRVRRGNTFDAHRVLHLAADRGLQQDVTSRFLVGYHTEGVAIADHDELARLSTEAGLDGDEVGQVLASDAYADAVRADEALARELGIQGVPFFVLNRAYGLSGAQPPAVLRRALEQARAAAPMAHQSHVHPHGEACDDGQCAV